MQRKLTPEGMIKRDVKQILRVLNFRVWNNLQMLGCEKGIPDLMAVRKIKESEFKKMVTDEVSTHYMGTSDMLIERIYNILEKEGAMVLFLPIEVKTEKGKLSPYQEKFLGELEEQGCKVVVARSADDILEGVEKICGQYKLWK